MNTEFVTKWLEALRSSEYAQCTNGGFADPIYDEHFNAIEYRSFCCLGLANHIHNVDPNCSSNLTKNVPELDTVMLDDQARELPGGCAPEAQKSLWAHLTAANDGSGIYKDNPHDFTQLADMIEKHLLKAGATR